MAALKAQFGVGNPILTDFGINPKKPTAQRTAAEKAVSVALAAQTKAARGSNLGKKQKEAVTASGTPGLVLVSATGQPMASSVKGPTRPGEAEPVDAAPGLSPSAPSTGSGTGSTPSK